MRRESCERFGFHCRHWGLSDEEHATMHAQIRRMDEVYAEDMAAGREVGSGSTSSVRQDGPRLVALLREEGFELRRVGS